MPKFLKRLLLTLISIVVITVLALTILFWFNGRNDILDTANPVGLADKSYTDSDRSRELKTYIWYPTDATTVVENHDDNAVFHGFPAILDAPISEGAYPLVVFSHGSGGNRANQGWLAVELARQGAIVVAANHPGSTSMDSAAATNILAWNRPQDISFIIDSVLADPQLAPHIDSERIAVVGHSLGGYTTLAIGGAVLSLDQFIDYCNDFPDNPDCLFYRVGEVDLAQVDRIQYEADHRDERVSAVVSIDPAYARSFQPESLVDMADTLLITAPVPEGDFGDLQVAFLAEQLALGDNYLEMSGAHHFTYLPECKPLGYYILMVVEADGELLCTPEVGESRANYHEMTTAKIVTFLGEKNILP